MTEDDIKRDRAICDAATPGPWTTDLDVFDFAEGIEACVTDEKINLLARLCIEGTALVGVDADASAVAGMRARESQELRDARFMAEARTRWPAALDEIERLQDQQPAAMTGPVDAVARVVELEAEVERLRAFADKVNAIRNDIVGRQTISFSAHVYPLVAALNEAGFEGEGYEVARERARSLINERDALAAEVEQLQQRITNQMNTIAACHAAPIERDAALAERDRVIAEVKLLARRLADAPDSTPVARAAMRAVIVRIVGDADGIAVDPITRAIADRADKEPT